MTEDEIKSLPILLTPDQARTILGIGRNTIYELVQQKKIPALHIGPKKIRIPKDELLNWIKASIQ